MRLTQSRLGRSTRGNFGSRRTKLKSAISHLHSKCQHSNTLNLSDGPEWCGLSDTGVYILTQHTTQQHTAAQHSRLEAAQLLTGWLPEPSKKRTGYQELAAVGPGACMPCRQPWLACLQSPQGVLSLGRADEGAQEVAHVYRLVQSFERFREVVACAVRTALCSPGFPRIMLDMSDSSAECSCEHEEMTFSSWQQFAAGRPHASVLQLCRDRS